MTGISTGMAQRDGSARLAEAVYYLVLHTRSCWFLRPESHPLPRSGQPPVIPRALPSVCEPPTSTSVLLKASASSHRAHGFQRGHSSAADRVPWPAKHALSSKCPSVQVQRPRALTLTRACHTRRSPVVLTGHRAACLVAKLTRKPRPQKSVLRSGPARPYLKSQS